MKRRNYFKVTIFGLLKKTSTTTDAVLSFCTGLNL
jgi:hypothetical protein